MYGEDRSRSRCRNCDFAVNRGKWGQRYEILAALVPKRIAAFLSHLDGDYIRLAARRESSRTRNNQPSHLTRYSSTLWTMDQIPGIPGAVPALTIYPEQPIPKNIPPTEWQACLDAWIQSLDVRLRLQDEHFAHFRVSQFSSGVPFLLSYGSNGPGSQIGLTSKEMLLRKFAYLLTRRFLLQSSNLNDWQIGDLIAFLLHVNQTFHNIPDWPNTINKCCQMNAVQYSHDLDMWKLSTTSAFDGPRGALAVLKEVRQMSSLVKIFPEVGARLMTSYDYLEGVVKGYGGEYIRPEDTIKVNQGLTEHLYWTLRSLMSDKTNHSSMLLDHLYQVKSDAVKVRKAKAEERTILSDMLCSTAFLRHLAKDAMVADTNRGRDLLQSLASFRESTKHLHSPAPRRRRQFSKGKSRANDADEMHIHQASQISQVHELFPDLSNPRILQLLDHFDNDVERVIAALLEPESLSHELPTTSDDIGGAEPDAVSNLPVLTPKSTQHLPPQRKNVFDNDDFDNLRVSTKQLHRGRRDINATGPATVSEHARSKAAIMAALAAFDSDDDERDDTYDVADVGGTVDQSVDTDNRPQSGRPSEQIAHEEVLFRAWKDSPELFARDSKTRVSRVRQDLKCQTQMSDEQIEGWSIMLSRDQKQQDRLQNKYAAARAFQGSQKALNQTKWQDNPSADNSTDEGEGFGVERSNDGRRMGQAQIRGARNWQGGRGGGAAGPASEASTQAARRRKEQGRGRGRGQKDGRARKMGRGMMGGPAQ